MSDAPKTQSDSDGFRDAVGYLLAGAFAGCFIGVCLMWHRFNDIESIHMAQMRSLKDQHRSHVNETVEEEVGRLQFQAASYGYAAWVLDHRGKPKFRWTEPKRDWDTSVIPPKTQKTISQRNPNI